MPAFTTSITVGGQPVIIADEAKHRGTIAWQKANSIFCPAGPAPSRAWLLMLRRDLNALPAGESHTITWKQQVGKQTTTREFGGFYLQSNVRVYPGAENDPKALHLVEFVDARGLASRMSDSTNLNANISAEDQDSVSLAAPTAYTWTSLCEELWDECPGLGDYPGLPYTPDGAPTNTRFVGASAWHSLCAVLDKLDCAVVHLPLTNEYKIVKLGEEQEVKETANRLKWTSDAKDFSVSDIPATIRVYFRKRYENFAQDRETEFDEDLAATGGVAYYDVSTSVAGAKTGTVLGIWDDLQAIIDSSNAISNSSELDTRKTNRANNRLKRLQTPRKHRILIGVEDIKPGERVRAVLWRNWGDYQGELGGTVTEYVQKPELVEIAHGGGVLTEFRSSQANDNYKPVDLARQLLPSYPLLSHTAFIAKTGGSPIAALTGSTPGSGTVTLYFINDTGALESTGITTTAYNIATSGEVAANTFIQIKRCAGKWIIDWEDCQE